MHALMAVAIAALFTTTACAPGVPVVVPASPTTNAPVAAAAVKRADLTGLVLAPIGFQALIMSSEIVAAGGGNMVAAGGGNMVAAGGGNMVAAGGGNVLPTGGGHIVGNAGGNLVAAGGGNIVGNAGGNLVAAGGGNMVAAGGGNLVAAGGGNMVAAGGGNMVAAGGGNMVAAGGGNLAGADKNIVAQGGGKILAGLVAAGGGNMVAAGGGNMVAAGGGNMVAAGGGNYRLAQGADDTDGTDDTDDTDDASYEDSQAPLVGAEVYLADTSGKALPQFKPTISDTTGHYTFKNVPEGLNVIVAVRIRAKGNVNGTMQTIATIRTGENQADVNLTTTMLAAVLLEDKEEGLPVDFDPAVFADTVARIQTQLDAFVESNPTIDLAAPQELHAGIIGILNEDQVLAGEIITIRVELVVETDPVIPTDDAPPPPTDANTPPADGNTPPTDGNTPPADGNTPPTDANKQPSTGEPVVEDGADDDDTPQNASNQVEILPGGVTHAGGESIRRNGATRK